MKVCLLTPEFLPEWGGVGTYAHNLAAGLVRRAEVHVVTANGAMNRREHELDGIVVHPLSPANGGSRAKSPLRFQLEVLRKLPRLARDHGWEIVHANHAYMSDLFARWRPTPASTVLTVHTTLDTQVRGTRRAGDGIPRERSEAKLTRMRFALQAIERRYLRKSPSMIFVSRWVRDRMVDRYAVAPRLGEVIPNAIDTDLFSPEGRETSARPTLLFAGRLLALKGVGTLLQAMTQLAPEVRLLLAGPGDPRPWLEFARRLGLPKDRYMFLGRIPYHEMPSLIQRAHAVVLPSFTESCSMTALEAMASGTPLIASAAGGIPEIVRDGETGWLFPPGDDDALARSIETVLLDGAAVDRVTERARAWVEANASIARMAERTFQFYEQTLSTGVAA